MNRSQATIAPGKSQNLGEIEFANTRIVLVREAQVRECLSLADAVDDLRTALTLCPVEGAVNAARVRVTQGRGKAWLHTLRAGLSCWGVAGGKEYTSIGFETPALWTTVVDTRTGLPLALIEADHLSRIRTAAVAALATDLLAPANPVCLAHFGAGKISRMLVQAILLVRPSIRTVRLVRRDASKGLPSWLANLPAVQTRLTSAQGALLEADLATTATNSIDPVIPAGIPTPRLRHINLIGSNHLKRKEIDRDLALRCIRPDGYLVADDPQQAALEAGDFAPLASEGRLDWSDIPSLHQLVRNPDRIAEARKCPLTTFKSVGVGLMDVIAAAGLLHRLGVLPES